MIDRREALSAMVDADPTVLAWRAAQAQAKDQLDKAKAHYETACNDTRAGIEKARAIHELTLEIERECAELAEVQQRIDELTAKRQGLINGLP